MQIKLPVRLAGIVFTLLAVPLPAAENIERAEERTARMYEVFHDAIFTSTPRSDFLMLDIGLGTDFASGTDAAAMQEVANLLANQKVLGRGRRAETPALGSIVGDYVGFINNQQVHPPSAEAAAKIATLQAEVNRHSTSYLEKTNAVHQTVLKYFNQHYSGLITFGQYRALKSGLNVQYETDAEVRAYQRALAALRQAEAHLGNAVWRWRQQQVSALSALNAVADVQCVPRLGSLHQDDGWTSIELLSRSLDKEHSRSETTGSFRGGGWFFRASGSYKKVTENDDSVLDEMEVSMKVKRISVYRDWFDSGAFLDQSYDPIVPKDRMPVLSTGTVGADGYYGGDGTNGTLPYIITDLIFVKDVVMRAPWKEEHYRFVSESTSGGGSFGFGPFRLGGGGGGRSWERVTSNVDEANGEIRIPTPQLIGFVVFKVPAAPIK